MGGIGSSLIVVDSFFRVEPLSKGSPARFFAVMKGFGCSRLGIEVWLIVVDSLCWLRVAMGQNRL